MKINTLYLAGLIILSTSIFISCSKKDDTTPSSSSTSSTSSTTSTAATTSTSTTTTTSSTSSTASTSSTSSSSPIGAWSKTFSGSQLVITITSSTYSITADGVSEVEHGACSISGSNVTFTAANGSCINVAGKYAFAVSGNTLTFTLVSDACDGRPDGIAGAWTK